MIKRITARGGISLQAITIFAKKQLELNTNLVTEWLRVGAEITFETSVNAWESMRFEPKTCRAKDKGGNHLAHDRFHPCHGARQTCDAW